MATPEEIEAERKAKEAKEEADRKAKEEADRKAKDSNPPDDVFSALLEEWNEWKAEAGWMPKAKRPPAPPPADPPPEDNRHFCFGDAFCAHKSHKRTK